MFLIAGKIIITTPPRTETNVPTVDASFLPNLSTSFLTKGINTNIGAKPTAITTPDHSALPKYVANITVFAVVADCMPRNIPIAATVAPTAGRFFMKLTNALPTLNFPPPSCVLTEYSSVRTVMPLIIKIKHANPKTPMISAAQKTLSPIRV